MVTLVVQSGSRKGKLQHSCGARWRCVERGGSNDDQTMKTLRQTLTTFTFIPFLSSSPSFPLFSKISPNLLSTTISFLTFAWIFMPLNKSDESWPWLMDQLLLTVVIIVLLTAIHIFSNSRDFLRLMKFFYNLLIFLQFINFFAIYKIFCTLQDLLQFMRFCEPVDCNPVSHLLICVAATILSDYCIVAFYEWMQSVGKIPPCCNYTLTILLLVLTLVYHKIEA